jgi:multidrug efflux pump subunit AcrA (membrane-fusion protein)
MRIQGFCVIVIFAIAGCTADTQKDGDRQPAPRPVSVLTLQSSDPSLELSVTGTAGSWKTEDLGFEVSGRIEYVIEPETNVDASPDASDGQPLARIDTERYETAVQSAAAQITRLMRQKVAAEIERDQVLPAQRDAAVADQVLAQADFDRAKKLIDENAIAKAEFDKFVATLKGAQASVAQLDATKEAKAAEVTSLDAQIEQARADLKDAQRNLDDCVLYAPFRGQIAEVHVIPGGTVQRGEPVLTLQMMDPIKVEFEASAERARQMRYKDTLDILFSGPNGERFTEEGVVWMTDSSADPSTRTFTITVLLRNRLVPVRVPDDVDRDSIPRTRDIWAMVRGILDDTDAYFVPEHAIQKDADGEYVWKIIEPGDGSSRSRGPLLTVEKVRVTSGEHVSSFLGLWTFRDVTLNESADFDPEQDRILGKLELPDGQTELTSNVVLFEREQWLLRPGDLVGVKLNERRMSAGFYVPMDAITEKSGDNFVFVVEDGRVRKTQVSVSDGPNTLKRVEATGSERLAEGTQIVLGGVHFLSDGDAVNVASIVEAN